MTRRWGQSASSSTKPSPTAAASRCETQTEGPASIFYGDATLPSTPLHPATKTHDTRGTEAYLDPALGEVHGSATEFLGC